MDRKELIRSLGRIVGRENVLSAEPDLAAYGYDASLYHCSAKPFAVPWEYTGWRDETMSWKETCYLHGNLKVSRFPYLSENRNQDVDVSQIPDGRKGAALDS